MKRATLKVALSTLVLSMPLVWAESAEDLAKSAQNPIANMISLPFQNNTNLGIGSADAPQNILNIQPVNDEWNLITRTIVPVVSQPDIFTQEGRIDGIGDTSFNNP